jgi:hypothetical protein
VEDDRPITTGIFSIPIVIAESLPQYVKVKLESRNESRTTAMEFSSSQWNSKMLEKLCGIILMAD